MIKKCKLCGKEFEPNKHQQKYCSSECSEEAIRKQRQQYYLEHKKDKKKKLCKLCGREFEPKHLNQKYCSSECSKEARRITRHKYYLEHKKEEYEYRRQWRNANKEKYQEYYRKYYWENHEKRLKYQREYNKSRSISKALAECERAHNDCYDCDMPVGVCRYD